MERQNTNSDEYSKKFYEKHRELAHQADILSTFAAKKREEFQATKEEIDEIHAKEKQPSSDLISLYSRESNQHNDLTQAEYAMHVTKGEYNQNITDANSHMNENIADYIDEAREDADKDGVALD